MTVSTQRQALNASIFLYKQVLDLQVGDSITPARGRRHRGPPTVMIQAEVKRLLAIMEGRPALMAKLI